VLLSYINKMTARHIPLTIQIIHNLITKLLERAPERNQPAAFLVHYKERICLCYLHLLNYSRYLAEKLALFKQFYTIVLCFFAVF
jgi:hypothetical protein